MEQLYLFYCLNKFGYGDNYIRWVKVLYSNPQADIMANWLISDSFPVHRGTRQGCPLFPLLFAMVTEPLAEPIRTKACKLTGYIIRYAFMQMIS